MEKNWLQSKTIRIAIIQGAVGILAAISLQHPDLGGILIAKSLLDIILRLNTSTEIK